MEIREINQMAEIPGETLSDLANHMNHLTLDPEVKAYVLAMPDVLMKKDMEEICPCFKLQETRFTPLKNEIVEVQGWIPKLMRVLTCLISEKAPQ